MRPLLPCVICALAVGGCPRDGDPLPARAEPLRSQAREAALGDVSALPAELRAALDPGDDFRPMGAPGPDDWLAQHEEPGQTYDQWLASRPNLPDGTRRVLYLLPLGALPAEGPPPLERLAAIVGAFYGLPARVLPTVSLEEVGATIRINQHTGQRQALSTDILAWLRGRVPADAYALIALTGEDLYPEPSWNFVFGQASLRERVGVHSFARYDPAFFGEARTGGWRTRLARRAVATTVHEMAHMFGLGHCIYWECVVAGSNHQAESDRRPLHLCPVCLRKVQRAAGFDPVARYAALEPLYRDAGLPEEARWVAGRRARLTAGRTTPGLRLEGAASP